MEEQGRMMIATGIDRATKDWIRNAADERAAENGCRFDEERAEFVVDWIKAYCRLYEGEDAGKQMELRDWQGEAVRRLFGWVKYSEEWGREVRRFRKGGIWVPKKNKKSPTLAAIGLFLFCGDGERGQKVFSCAKDGNQARIAHTHAMEMVRQSPALSAECTINKTTGRIAHEPSRSVYDIIAGDNVKSQEGLNGSILVDETHVVNRRLMKRIRRAGISRAEPLHLETSTAGDDPDSYGKEQFDYGAKVNSGEMINEGYFYLAYGAPQDVSNEDVEKNLIDLGRKANPAWDHTVKESEFVADYEESKVSPSSMADFKMYRLNVWQHTSSPFLDIGAWHKCGREFDESDLLGRECYAGLDLSRTRDMSSISLVFPESEEEFTVLPYFWLPESVAREENHRASFLEWADRGYLELTPGEVIDYGYIKSVFRELSEKFVIRELAYDDYSAEEVTQSMSEGVMGKGGEVVEEGTGVMRVRFPQKITMFASPTDLMERLVISGKLHHNNHPILTWQAGHVNVWTDANRNKRPVKPKRGDIRTIDGIVSTIMALGRAMVAEETKVSVYEEPGNLSL